MKTKNIIIYSLFTAFICVFSCIAIPIGAVPLTFGIMAVVITSLILGAKGGVIATLLYILLGSFGLPVFAGFAGGFHVVAGPTGGYIWSYLVVAFMTGKSADFAKKGKEGIALKMLIAFVSLMISYLIGTFWFAMMQKLSVSSSLVICVYPFVLFDVIKMFFAVYTAEAVNRRMNFML